MAHLGAVLRLAVLVFLAGIAQGATPTFGTITAVAASPNSATVSVTVTGGVSMQIQASSDTSYGITTPWFPVASSAIAAQLLPATLYNVRVVACDQAVTAWSTCGGNQGTSGTATVTTSAAIRSWPTSWTMSTTASYNAVQYPLNGRWMDGDTGYWAWKQDGTIVAQHNDGKGPQGAYDNNVFMTTVDSAFTTFTALNRLTGFGAFNAANTPACYSDGSTAKSSSLLADGNTLYWIAYRQSGTGYVQADGAVYRSDDGGATWYNPSHTSGEANANGDPACPGAGVMWSGHGKFSLPRFVKGGGQGGVVTNPVHGIDAYQYIQFRDNDNTFAYLARVFKRLNYQTIGNYEYYVGGIGGNEDLQANWSTTSSGAVAVGTLSEHQQDWEIQYLPDFGRFVVTAENVRGANDYRLVVLDSAQLTGPYAVRYQEPTRPPFNSAAAQYLERAWLTIWMPTYTTTASNPPAATIQILQNGTFSQQSPEDPPNDLYSPWLSNMTVTADASANHMLIGAAK